MSESHPEAGAELEAALSALAATAGEPDAPEPDFDALAAALDRETGPVAWLRSRTQGERFGLLLAVAAVVSVVLAGLRGPLDLATLTESRLVLEMGLLGGLALLGMAGAVRGYHQPALPRWTGWALVGATLLAPVAMAVLQEPSTPGDPPRSAAFGCLLFGLCVSAPVLVLATVLDRGAWIGRPTVRYAACAAGLAALVGLRLRCPVQHTEHLMLGHVPVVAAMLITAGVLALLVRR